jgi:tetratricopeptide (TPR) repeat protein
MLSTPEPQNPLQHNNRAVELGRKGLWAAAIHEHELALAGDPYNQTFRMNLSGACLRYGDQLTGAKKYYEAMKQYRMALYVDPTNQVADANLDHCLEAIHKNPNDVKYRMSLGDEADISGDYPEAIVEYRRCVKMLDNGPSHAKLGRVLIKQGSRVPDKMVEGYEELRTAVTKDWKLPDETNDLAACHRELGDILKDAANTAKNLGHMQTYMQRLLNADIEYRRAVTLNPNDTNAIKGLIEVSREAVAVAPSFDNLLTLGGAYQLAGDFERAKACYEQCWKLKPNDPSLIAARRSFHLAIVKAPLASPMMLASTVQKTEDALRQNPDDPELLYVYGRGKEAQGDKATALTAYQAAAKINPLINPDLEQGIRRLTGEPQASATSTNTNPATNTQPTKSANGTAAPAQTASAPEKAKDMQAHASAEAKLRAGDLDGAEKEFSAIVDKDPQDGEAWKLLGTAQEKQGQLDAASVCYRQASYLKEPGADALLHQIDIVRTKPTLDDADKQIQQGNFIAAKASLSEAESIAPNLAIVHRRMAEVLRKLNDSKDADREEKRANELDKNDKS